MLNIKNKQVTLGDYYEKICADKFTDDLFTIDV
ncbi:MAG: hypothetical protein SRB1_01686 [Desulfobacteraceae bacterium Eth-SRB1]|nr:MAG: hypothetical protein SRB1_01686 [Desulfobacteraceae bacterium Eth-SRB1]